MSMERYIALLEELETLRRGNRSWA